MAGDEHDRQVALDVRQPFLQIEPAQARQAQIEHEAARPVDSRPVQELLRRGEGLDLPPLEPDQGVQ